MSYDSKFWVSIWAIAGITIASILYFSTSYFIDKNAKIVEAIKNGADPIATVCALDNDGDYSSVCIVMAAKK